MSKKKLKMLAWAAAVALAFVPFLHGCAMDNPQENADQSAHEQQNTGSTSEVVRYGRVVAINGDEVSVSLGMLEDAKDGSGMKTFQTGEGEITFDRGDVSVVNESGAVVESSEFSTDDIIVMQGSGEDAGFKPRNVEILSSAGSGVVADDARIPEGI